MNRRRPPSPSRRAVAAFACAFVLALDYAAATAPAARAEVGVDEMRADVERQRTKRERFPTADGYDVRIAPPPPPGASPPVPSNGPVDAPFDAPRGAPLEGPHEGPTRATDGVAVDGAAPPVKPPSDFDDPPGPGLHTLQVGAYRSLGNARALKENLSRNFEDVYLSEVSSGGLPLFRVRVGRFATDEQRDEIRRSLRLAGHPSFDVNDAFLDDVPATD